MLRYTTDRARPGLVALYDIRSGNGAGQFLQPRSQHGDFMALSEREWRRNMPPPLSSPVARRRADTT